MQYEVLDRIIHESEEYPSHKKPFRPRDPTRPPRNPHASLPKSLNHGLKYRACTPRFYIWYSYTPVLQVLSQQQTRASIVTEFSSFHADKSEPIPHKPRVSRAVRQMVRQFPNDRVSQNSSYLDRSEEYRADHSDLPRHKNIASAPMVATRPLSSGSETRLLSATLQAMKRLRCCPLPSGPKPFSAAEIANLPSGRLHYQRHPRRTEIHCWASDLK